MKGFKISIEGIWKIAFSVKNYKSMPGIYYFLSRILDVSFVGNDLQDNGFDSKCPASHFKE